VRQEGAPFISVNTAFVIFRTRFDIPTLENDQRKGWRLCFPRHVGNGQRSQFLCGRLEILEDIPIPGDEPIVGMQFVDAKAVAGRVGHHEGTAGTAYVDHRASRRKRRQLRLDEQGFGYEPFAQLLHFRDYRVRHFSNSA
jgi:hypothetical protein